jgi:hypothetical protein
VKQIKSFAMKENLFKNWYFRKELQSFLGFGNTKMTQLNKEYGIRKVKIGKKVFYSVEDVERLFKKNESD